MNECPFSKTSLLLCLSKVDNCYFIITEKNSIKINNHVIGTVEFAQKSTCNRFIWFKQTRRRFERKMSDYVQTSIFWTLVLCHY